MACGRAYDIESRHILRLISNVFRNSNAWPLYHDTVPLTLCSDTVARESTALLIIFRQLRRVVQKIPLEIFYDG